MDISYRNILKVSFPLMIGMFIQSFVMITDAAFVSNLGTFEYDAVGNAGVLYLALIMFLQGISDTGQIITARRLGENKPIEVGKIFRHLILIIFVIAFFIFLLFTFFTDTFLSSTVSNSNISNIMGTYFDYRKFGILFEAVRIAIIAFYIGVGRTKVIIYTTLILAIGNIFLDYCLIFGHFGFPELGVKGAAIASSTAELLALIFLVFYLVFDKRNKIYALFSKIKLDLGIGKSFLTLAPPLMLQGLISHGAWYLFFSMIESLGPQKLEISHVIRNIYYIAFIPLYGFSATTKTFVSNLLGSDRADLIKKYLGRAIQLNLIFLIICLHGLLLYPGEIVSLINKNTDLLSNQIVFEEIKTIFLMVFGSMILFGVCSPLYSAVSGTGNTKTSMLIEISAISLYITFSYLFVYILKYNLIGVWSVEYIYFGSLGVFSFLYLKFANWKTTEI